MKRSVAGAIEEILKEVPQIKTTQRVSVESALHHILAEDVVACITQPPFRRSAMDGYAVYSQDIFDASQDHPVTLPVVGKMMAGDKPFGPLRRGTAVRIMTGAAIPDGADCVVKQEATVYGEDNVSIYMRCFSEENCCPVGEDFIKGAVLASKGSVVDPYLVATAAAAGVSSLCVKPKIKVSLITTGSELVGLGEPLPEGAIYDSQMPFLSTRLTELDCEIVHRTMVKDSPEAIKKLIEASKDANLIITTGGVSVGKADYIPQIMTEMKANVVFQGISIKPGMPTMLSLFEGIPVLSLSGNPYSAIAMLELLFPYVEQRLLGRTTCRLRRHRGKLLNGYSKFSPVTRILRGALEEDGVIVPTAQENGQLAGGIHTDCLVEIPAGKPLAPGSECVFYIIR